MKKIGCSAQSNSVVMRKYCDFIDDMELIDLPVVGNKFTWFNFAGSSMSSLDQFLISTALIYSWKLKFEMAIGRKHGNLLSLPDFDKGKWSELSIRV